MLCYVISQGVHMGGGSGEVGQGQCQVVGYFLYSCRGVYGVMGGGLRQCRTKAGAASGAIGRYSLR